MTSMTDTPATASTSADTVIAGVDTHGETHHAAVLDERGRELADREFAATPSGYAAMLSWALRPRPPPPRRSRGHRHLRRRAAAVPARARRRGRRGRPTRSPGP